jgi:hypothetical protein
MASADEQLYGAAFDFGTEWSGAPDRAAVPGESGDGAPIDYTRYEGDVDLVVDDGAGAEFTNPALREKINAIGRGRLGIYQTWKDSRIKKAMPNVAAAAELANSFIPAPRRAATGASIFEELGVAPPPIGEIILPPDDHMTIFDIDPRKYETQPWTVPNANLVQWFNFGMNEHSWREYCHRQRRIRNELKQLVAAHVAAHGQFDPPIQISATFETAAAAQARAGPDAVPAIPHHLQNSGVLPELPPSAAPLTAPPIAPPSAWTTSQQPVDSTHTDDARAAPVQPPPPFHPSGESALQGPGGHRSRSPDADRRRDDFRGREFDRDRHAGRGRFDGPQRDRDFGGRDRERGFRDRDPRDRDHGRDWRDYDRDRERGHDRDWDQGYSRGRGRGRDDRSRR